jgi:uncharacterized membrane protein
MSIIPFLVMKILHLLFVSLWVGGIVLTVVINRGLRRYLQSIDATKTLGIIGRVIQKSLRLSLYLAIVTGLALLVIRGVDLNVLFNTVFYTTRFGSMLLGKILSVVAVLILLPLHSRYGSAIYETQDGKTYVHLRRRILAVGWATLIFSILAIVFGTGLRVS